MNEAEKEFRSKYSYAPNRRTTIPKRVEEMSKVKYDKIFKKGKVTTKKEDIEK